MSIFGVIMVRIFPAFSRIRTLSLFNISPFSVRMRENGEKMRTRITPNTDSFYAVGRANVVPVTVPDICWNTILISKKLFFKTNYAILIRFSVCIFFTNLFSRAFLCASSQELLDCFGDACWSWKSTTDELSLGRKASATVCLWTAGHVVWRICVSFLYMSLLRCANNKHCWKLHTFNMSPFNI